MKNIVFSLFLVFGAIPAAAFAGSPIRGVPTPGVEEFYVNDGLILTSSRNHEISMYNTLPDVTDTCNFFVVIRNRSPFNETFFIDHLRVTDQDGYRIPIVSKKRLKKKINRREGFEGFFQGLGHFLEADSVLRDAGRIDYHEVQTSHHQGDYDLRTPGFYAKERIREKDTTVTHGHSYNPSLRRHEIREMAEQQAFDDWALEQKYAEKRMGVDENYLANHTLAPGENFARHFQIRIPKELRDDLETIHFTYDFGGEKHTFVYAVKPKRGKYWR